VAALQSPETRRSVLVLAQEHGFTHVAIELPSDH
jgi:predicted kinase